MKGLIIRQELLPNANVVHLYVCVCILYGDVELCSLCSVMYYNYAGGVIAMNPENFIRLNGFSNSYWGWGNEDDDLSARYWMHLLF